MEGVFCTRDLTEDRDGGPQTVSARLHELLPGSRIFCLTQIHSDRIIRAEDSSPGDFPEADGIVSQNPADVLCIRTADCVPVLLRADDSSLIGAVHAGWRGLAQDIVYKAVILMQSYGSEKIQVFIGPSIGPCCYQVGPEVVRALGAKPVARKDCTVSVDLAEIASGQAMKAGLAGEAIHVVRSCTCCNGDKFFSFRRDKYGRNSNRKIHCFGDTSGAGSTYRGCGQDRPGSRLLRETRLDGDKEAVRG
jgi:YfiH family protein